MISPLAKRVAARYLEAYNYDTTDPAYTNLDPAMVDAAFVAFRYFFSTMKGIDWYKRKLKVNKERLKSALYNYNIDFSALDKAMDVIDSKPILDALKQIKAESGLKQPKKFWKRSGEWSKF